MSGCRGQNAGSRSPAAVKAGYVETDQGRFLSFFPDEAEVVYPPATPFLVSSLVTERAGAILILDEA
jgi:hypothetical protein